MHPELPGNKEQLVRKHRYLSHDKSRFRLANTRLLRNSSSRLRLRPTEACDHYKPFVPTHTQAARQPKAASVKALCDALVVHTRRMKSACVAENLAFYSRTNTAEEMLVHTASDVRALAALLVDRSEVRNAEYLAESFRTQQA